MSRIDFPCMKLFSYGACAALIGSLLIGSPQSLAQNAQSSPSGPLRLTVTPHASTRIAMKTLPKAVCLLHVDGDSDTSRSFKLFSDDDGMIRFNVNPRMQSDQVAAFAVDCTSEGQSGTFGLELRPHPIPSLDMPAPSAEMRAPKATDVIRPALTEDEILQLSDDELSKREYPMRPNPKQAPDAYANWLKAVTKPARRVDARQVATEIHASSNWELVSFWSGFELRNPVCSGCVGYDAVMGDWVVPTVRISDNGLHTDSAFWIGLDGDGDGTSDLWQAGTDQEIYNYTWAIFSIDISRYYAWTEFWPQAAQNLANFNVSAGDEIFTTVWVANQEQAPSLQNEMFGVASVEDVTQGEYALVSYCLGSVIDGRCTNLGQIPILGREAEWIMERPCVSNCTGGPSVSADLADYNVAWMYDAYALQTNGQWMNYNGANNQDIWMYNSSSGHLLSVPYVWNSSTIQYYWYNWQ